MDIVAAITSDAIDFLLFRREIKLVVSQVNSYLSIKHSQKISKACCALHPRWLLVCYANFHVRCFNIPSPILHGAQILNRKCANIVLYRKGSYDKVVQGKLINYWVEGQGCFFSGQGTELFCNRHKVYKKISPHVQRLGREQAHQ